MSGVICNVLQTVIYSTAVQKLDGIVEPARIYSFLYMFMMFVGHGMGALLVFGWPKNRYWSSFLSNAPIGIIGMLIGTTLTVFLTWIRYDEMIINLIKTYAPIMPVKEHGDLYSLLLVMGVTNMWTFAAANHVNKQPSKEKVL
jgi:ABC-type lipoprotein release transport system permease subunit